VSGNRRQEFDRIWKFAVVGICATAVHAASYSILAMQLLSPLGANTAGFCAAVGVSYIGHSFWTFSDKAEFSGREFARWCALSISGFLLNTGFVIALVDLMHFHYLIAVLPMLFITPILTFLLARFRVFNRNSN